MTTEPGAAPNLTHMEKAREILKRARLSQSNNMLWLADALAAEHDAALEKAAKEMYHLRVRCDERGDSQYAIQAYDYAESAIRAMKNGEGR